MCVAVNYVVSTSKTKCLAQVGFAETFILSSKNHSDSAAHAFKIRFALAKVAIQGNKALAFFIGKTCLNTVCQSAATQLVAQA